MKRTILLTAAVFLVSVLAGPLAAQQLVIEGSTTVGPIVDAFKARFDEMHPEVRISVSKTGSGNGATALIEGRCDIAMMSRFMKPSKDGKEGEFAKAVANGVYPVAHAIANDGVCVVVHPSNPVKALTTEQARDIYTGKITNWKELGGLDMKIIPVSRDSASGTYETFEGLVMKKQDMAAHVEYVSSNPQAQARVKTTPGAVGYVGLAFLDGVRALDIDGVAPTRRTVASGTYPISRPLFLFTNGYPELGTLTHEFVTFYLTETGQEIIEAKGFVPLTSY
jgi:phosphate transport system substrate-binding protein